MNSIASDKKSDNAAKMSSQRYTPTIGIEVHAELKTKSKMFCGCKNDPHASEVNANTCPVCLAHPGTLPSVNKEAVKKVLQVGEALGGSLASYSEFDRKNYFYPDIPKAYQLSQYAFPFVSGGELAGVAITRVHLEEDTARSQHFSSNDLQTKDPSSNNFGSATGESLVDFNRAGVPLMELVTEPVIHDAKTAGNFARELQLLLRTLGVSDANMERGEMRVEANISISDSDKLGTKVEVKNLNSFKSVEQAIEFEISRQTENLLQNKPIKQETRGWDEGKQQTFSQRSKETAEDYRYFPDPDIPKYDLESITEFSSESLTKDMPELPDQLREKWLQFGLKPDQVAVLLYERPLKTFFEGVLAKIGAVDNRKIQIAANYLTSDIAGLMQSSSALKLDSTNVIQFVALIEMVMKGDITSRVAKDLLEAVVFEGMDPEVTAKEKGLLQTSSTEALLPVVKKVIMENQKVADDYRAGKEASLQYLIGQTMKETKGSANPSVLTELFKQELTN